MVINQRPGSCRSRSVPIDNEVYAQWQDIADILAALLQIPAALVMRADDETIEVFVSSASDGNPYKKGDSEHLWGSGLYCERVIHTQERLLVPDAPADPEWAANPDIKLNMISYLGYPLSFPDGAYFGTLCILDNKANAYSPEATRILQKFQEVIQGNLALLQLNHELDEDNRSLSDLCERVRALKGMHPICSHCSNIRNTEGQWEKIENYISTRSQAAFSHTICEECMKIHHPDTARRMGLTD